MTNTGTISGIQSAFGARWDDARKKAPLKTSFRDTIGYYDDRSISRKAHPAPAVISEMIDADDILSAHAVFYHDDDGSLFGSVIFSAGQVAPLSEIVYESSDDWEHAISVATDDENIDQVHVPVGVDADGNEKRRVYDMSSIVPGGEDGRKDDLPKIVPTSNIVTVLIIILMALVIAAIPVGAWIFIAKPFAKTASEVEFRMEKLKPDFSAIMDRCGEDLADPWPAPPEWTLAQEGCVAAPELAKISFPKPSDQRAYAYRYYTLDASIWDDFLSRASFLKMAERFPGKILEGVNQVILYMPYDIERHVMEDSYMPDTFPAEILRRSFVGALKVDANTGAGGATASTSVELQKVLERLSGKRLTPSHVYRNFRTRQTGLEVAPERIESRRVRID